MPIDSATRYASPMAGAEIRLTTEKPAEPPADFVFEIDFVKGAGSASRVFAATHEFIKACEALDAELVQSIDNNIKTLMVLEDIQVGSIKTFLKSLLESTNDDALKTLDWKAQVGEYLVKAKYAVIEWCEDGSSPRELAPIRQKIQRIAAETDVRHLPDYAPPSPRALINAMRDFQEVKDNLIPGDRASMITAQGNVSLNLSLRWPIEDIEALAVARAIEQPAMEMILAVKKPDYLGTSQWDLRLAKRTIQARIEDEAWLSDFQSRKVDVRPGDALRCRVRLEHLYGHDNELISERFTIVEVMEVMVNRYIVHELPFGGDGATFGRSNKPERDD